MESSTPTRRVNRPRTRHGDKHRQSIDDVLLQSTAAQDFDSDSADEQTSRFPRRQDDNIRLGIELNILIMLNRVQVLVENKKYLKAAELLQKAREWSLDDLDDNYLNAKCAYWAGVIADVHDRKVEAARAFLEAMPILEKEYVESADLPQFLEKYTSYIKEIVANSSNEADPDEIMERIRRSIDDNAETQKYVSQMHTSTAMENIAHAMTTEEGSVNHHMLHKPPKHPTNLEDRISETGEPASAETSDSLYAWLRQETHKDATNDHDGTAKPVKDRRSSQASTSSKTSDTAVATNNHNHNQTTSPDAVDILMTSLKSRPLRPKDFDLIRKSTDEYTKRNSQLRAYSSSTRSSSNMTSRDPSVAPSAGSSSSSNNANASSSSKRNSIRVEEMHKLGDSEQGCLSDALSQDEVRNRIEQANARRRSSAHNPNRRSMANAASAFPIIDTAAANHQFIAGGRRKSIADAALASPSVSSPLRNSACLDNGMF